MTTRNLPIDERTKQEINGIIDRIHHDLKPKNDIINLAEVRELLKLDLGYYKTSDPSLLDDVVHKMRVGAHQIINAPTKLITVVRKFGLSALFLPERRRILLDEDIPPPKKRWAESHEITHSVLSWHQEYMLGDTLQTISPECHEQIEAEANHGAGRLIYPVKSLITVANSSSPSMKHVRAISSHFRNSITSALWRYVEIVEFPCVGIIGEHPHHCADVNEAIVYFIRSPSFVARFAKIDETQIFEILKSYCAYRKSGGPLGTHQFILTDDSGNAHIFTGETFSNTHQVLTLISYVSPSGTQVVVPASAF